VVTSDLAELTVALLLLVQSMATVSLKSKGSLTAAVVEAQCRILMNLL
jgi:hypothetical protein